MKSWLILLLVGIAGCGSDGGMQVEVEITVLSDCTATISWKPPTERVDGTPFSVEEIGRYDLFIGLESGVYYRAIGIEDKYLTQWTETGLLGGLNYFTATVTDLGGLESKEADEVVRQVESTC